MRTCVNLYPCPYCPYLWRPLRPLFPLCNISRLLLVEWRFGFDIMLIDDYRGINGFRAPLLPPKPGRLPRLGCLQSHIAVLHGALVPINALDLGLHTKRPTFARPLFSLYLWNVGLACQLEQMVHPSKVGRNSVRRVAPN